MSSGNEPVDRVDAVSWLSSQEDPVLPVNTADQYTEDSIHSLDALQHIRRRPGMYIGRLGNGQNANDGIYVLLKEIIDNSVDEFIAGFGHSIELEIDPQHQRVRVRDYGRGIPLGKVIDCVSTINTGAKYNDRVFQYSVGLNGVGTKAVNALSSFFKIVSYRQQQAVIATFERGILQHHQQLTCQEPDGTLVEFWPDEQIFSSFAFESQFIEERLMNYSCLNRDLRLVYGEKTFSHQQGLADFLATKIDFSQNIYPLIAYRDQLLEFAFTHQTSYGETSFSFVNGQCTSDGGSHLSAFREGVLRGINDFYQHDFQSSDLRDGFISAVAIRMQEPLFESQTKNKLGNTELRKPLVAKIRKLVADYLYRQPLSAESLEQKLKTNAQVRKEISDVRKAARSASKKSLFKIPQLKDCKYHYNDRKVPPQPPTIFITEGQSATGPLVSVRDVNYQAIYSLRGKPWNCWGYSQADMYRNQELYYLMLALGIDRGEDHLRYQKIILATDADDDGCHIRNLLLTYFLYFFPNIVLREHVFILETPLFRVRNRQQTHYCYSQSERNHWAHHLGKGAEITRFKGLGEISPQEFGQFIGTDMRVIKVDINEPKRIPALLKFYMGKNTPERRQYIVENLADELENELIATTN